MRLRLGPRGELVLPEEALRRLGLRPGDEVELLVEEESLHLKPPRSIPLESLLGSLASAVSYPGPEGEKEARETSWTERFQKP
ncbi:AbrB/MazE/SpoVT family DNA-binding domain-containing protein [Thermus sp.]|uniref:AbrB/MazE/SpoVT family DNA-binding domain-containing protein n=1 Tax=Thermus sp. TaxID=275 RepID=UPI00307F12E0